eukprot:m.390374 g.390374  ORF g.390374 m.390374 type:complete len:157 (+) comp21058_c0_seq3:2860-3330(+)
MCGRSVRFNSFWCVVWRAGAYGGGAGLNNGLFQFFSYRDPNTLATLHAFDNAIEWAVEGGATEADIVEAKLGIFQGMDAPVSPSNRGNRLFASGITDEMVQTRREQLLDVTAADVARVAATYLSSDALSANVIIGTETEAAHFEQNSDWVVSSIDL